MAMDCGTFIRGIFKSRRIPSKIAVLIVIGAALATYPLAVCAFTLEECQKDAVNNRKVIEKYKDAVEIARLDERIGRSAFLPRVDAAYTANQLDEDGAFENSENSSLTGRVSWNVFSGFRDRYRVESAELIRKTKAFELDSLLQDIKHGVAVRYLDIFDKQNRLNIAKEEYNLLVRRYVDAENRHSVGLIRKNDLLKIKVDMDNAQQKMKQAEAGYEKSVNLLENMIGESLDGRDPAFTEFESLPAVLGEDAYEARIQNRNEIKALETAAEAEKKKVLSAESAYYPSVDLVGAWSLYGDDYVMGLGDDSEDELRLQINVNINLYDGGKKYYDIRKAKLNVSRVEKDLYELKQDFATELENILLDYYVTLENLKVSETGISQADENLRVADISFKEGVETATDVLDAIFSLSRAKYNYVNAKNALYLNYFGLRRMIDDY